MDTNNWGKCEVGSNILKLNAEIELDQADWYGNLPIHHECSRLDYLSEKGRERDSFVSSTQMEATKPTVSTKERHLESLNKIKEFVRRNPDCVKQSNQFGYLPLHSSLDKTSPNALVVEYLVEIFPDALYIACNEGWRNIYPFDIFCEVSLTHPALSAVSSPFMTLPRRATVCAGMKPYDFLLKWNHSDEIFWIVLNANPSLDWR